MVTEAVMIHVDGERGYWQINLSTSRLLTSPDAPNLHKKRRRECKLPALPPLSHDKLIRTEEGEKMRGDILSRTEEGDKAPMMTKERLKTHNTKRSKQHRVLTRCLKWQHIVALYFPASG